jgi:ribosomal-protein-alanine N-acetyltransferase
MDHVAEKPVALKRGLEFAAIEDVPELVHIEQQCYPHPWSAARFEQECKNPDSYILLKRTRGEIEAYLCFWYLGLEVEIHNIACAPQYRRSGAAHILLQSLDAWCRAHRVEQVFLEVRSSNVAAINLYRASDFTLCGRRSGYYGDGEDALLMCCDLRHKAQKEDKRDKTDEGYQDIGSV